MSKELILTFHGLGEPPDPIGDDERKVWVPVAWFEAIVEALPRDGVRLAFDDGNTSDVEHALPRLAQRGITAHFFPLTGRIGVARSLSAQDILNLSAAGMQIGSHGLHHRDWRRLHPAELDQELTLSRRALADILGSDVAEAACPFGSYDRRVLRALHAAGYRRVFNSDGGTTRAGSWLSSRTTVDRSRPLQRWLDLVARGAHGWPNPMLMGRRLAKRIR